MIKTPQGILLRRARTKARAAEPFRSVTSYVAWGRELERGDLGLGCHRLLSNLSVPELELLAAWVANTLTPFSKPFPVLGCDRMEA